MSKFLHHNNVDSLVWLQSSAEWHASYLQAYELAKIRIDEAMKVASKEKNIVLQLISMKLFLTIAPTTNGW